jgi:hypothetical protein
VLFLAGADSISAVWGYWADHPGLSPGENHARPRQAFGQGDTVQDRLNNQPRLLDFWAQYGCILNQIGLSSGSVVIQGDRLLNERTVESYGSMALVRLVTSFGSGLGSHGQAGYHRGHHGWHHYCRFF